MSCDVVIWEGAEPINDEDRQDTVNAIGTCYFEARVGTPQPPTQRITDFVEALLRRWPDIGQEGSPWARGVTQYACGPALSVAVVWRRVDDVAPGIAQLAKEHGLQCYVRG
ncbi:hypothetical protein AB0L82_35335 [Nocardia sp. NPDC052001]|uniref:hypothetical protein n=1 Tax=Nocardia sp. NPDC052001 TaxID=3154853 RepID=UPI0034180BB8